MTVQEQEVADILAIIKRRSANQISDAHKWIMENRDRVTRMLEANLPTRANTKDIKVLCRNHDFIISDVLARLMSDFLEHRRKQPKSGSNFRAI